MCWLLPSAYPIRPACPYYHQPSEIVSNDRPAMNCALPAIVFSAVPCEHELQNFLSSELLPCGMLLLTDDSITFSSAMRLSTVSTPTCPSLAVNSRSLSAVQLKSEATAIPSHLISHAIAGHISLTSWATRENNLASCVSCSGGKIFDNFRYHMKHNDADKPDRI